MKRLYDSWTCPPGMKSPLAELADLDPEIRLTDEEREEAKKKLEEKLKPYRAGRCIMYIKGLGYMRR